MCCNCCTPYYCDHCDADCFEECDCADYDWCEECGWTTEECECEVV